MKRRVQTITEARGKCFTTNVTNVGRSISGREVLCSISDMNVGKLLSSLVIYAVTAHTTTALSDAICELYTKLT